MPNRIKALMHSVRAKKTHANASKVHKEAERHTYPATRGQEYSQ